MKTFSSPLPDVAIPDAPLTEFVLRRVPGLASKTAMIDGPSGRQLTFAELAEQVARCAGGFASKGLAAGDTVGVLLPNVLEYAVVFHGVATAGGVNTTINPTYTVEEVAYQLRDAGARFVVTAGPFLEVAREAARDAGVEQIIVAGPHEQGTTSLEELLAAEPAEQVPVDPAEALVALPYSSGTTGLPKGVMLTHRNLVANLAQCEGVLTFGSDDVVMAVLPFFHIYGMQVVMNAVLAEGATSVLMPRFDLEQFLGLVQEHRVTRAFVVPPIVLALAKHPVVDQYDLSSIEQLFSGAAPLGADLASEAAARIGCEVVQGYGMTELSPVSHATPPGGFRPGSVGVLVPNTECRVVDPATGSDCDAGTDGEIWVRGPQVMKGYLNNPEATAATIDEDGWLHTGDIGHVDEDGYWFIVDRLKELIKYKGFQVAPAELEALLLRHPAVADAAVIGMPDPEAGEVPKAFVVLKPDQQATAEQIQAFVAEHVAHYKQLREVEVISEIPKSPSGKILRRLLRESAVS